jgi:indole-3-glycerol phosphate synthase
LILDQILATKRDEIAALKESFRSGNSRELIERCNDAEMPPTRGFKNALLNQKNKSRPVLIAEVKKASPSKGVIRADFDPISIARAYELGGAACLSVLTDRDYFQGELGYLTQIKAAATLPLLRKDFLIDPIQIYEARLAGADAILLIVAAIPSPARLAELRHAAELLGMDVLVEVHSAAELQIALDSGATLIGVNNRNLQTFQVDLALFETLAPQLPSGCVAVAESGIFTHADAQRMHAAGAHAILVGESLMRQDDVLAATKTLLGR